MRNTKRGTREKAFSCLMAAVLVLGLCPSIALADESYPDVDHKIYAGPEESTTVNVGNVTVEGDSSTYDFAAYASAKQNQSAEINAHGNVTLTSDEPCENAVGAVSAAQTNTSTVNITGDVTVNIDNADNPESAVFGVDASAAAPGAEAVMNVDGNVTATNVASGGDHLVYGVITNAMYGTEDGQNSTSVVVGGDVVAEAVDKTGALNGEATGVSAFAANACDSSTVVKGGVYAKGDDAYGVDVKMNSSSTKPVTDAGTTATILIGKGGVTVEGDKSFATGLSVYNNGGSATISVAGDVKASSKSGGEAGVYADGFAGMTDILVNGVISSKMIGVVDGTQGGQLIVTAWKIDSDIVAGKSKGQELVEDEATEKAINYIIKVEQPQEGNILKLLGTAVKEMATTEGVGSFDVANMDQKVYLSVEDGWTITAAFNGLGEKVALEKDDGGWYVIVPNGGGVYLSAQVAKIEPGPGPEPEPEPEPAPGPTPGPTPASFSDEDTSGRLPATGDSGAPIVALALVASAGLVLTLTAFNRSRRRIEE